MRRSTFLSIASLLFVSVMALSSGRASASVLSKQLGQDLPELRMDGAALTDAIDLLRDLSGANISVNWKALAAEGVTPESTVTLKLRHVSLRRGLDLILAEAGAGDKLGWTIDQNVVEVSTRALIDTKMYTRVYPIGDLLLVIPDFIGPRMDITSSGGNSGQSGSGTGNSTSSSEPPLFPPESASEDKPKTRTERASELVDLIRNVIRPEIWTENGGNAAIRYWNGNLIVTAPRSVQEALGGSLD